MKSGPKGPSKWKDDEIAALADKLLTWSEVHTNFLLAKFCDEHNVYPDLLSRLAKRNKGFRRALKKAKAHQEAVLSEGGVNGEFNPAVTIFLLKNVAGYRDKKDIDHTTKGKPIPIYGGTSVQGHDSDTQDIRPEEAD